MKDEIRRNRRFMRSDFGTPVEPSDQQKGLPQPPLEKPLPDGTPIQKLPEFDDLDLKKPDVLDCLKSRRSRRQFSSETLTLKEISFLLWATQGVDEVLGDGYATLRPVPSAGARHPFETYLFVNRVTGLQPGIHRCLSSSHELAFLTGGSGLPERLTEACLGQGFVGSAPIVFIWSCIPYRGEWRYKVKSHKVMLLDAGHVCQNLYLGCEAIGCGTCGIGAYDQRKVDNFLDLDGDDEFIVYLAPVGRTS